MKTPEAIVNDELTNARNSSLYTALAPVGDADTAFALDALLKRSLNRAVAEALGNTTAAGQADGEGVRRSDGLSGRFKTQR